MEDGLRKVLLEILILEIVNSNPRLPTKDTTWDELYSSGLSKGLAYLR